MLTLRLMTGLHVGPAHEAHATSPAAERWQRMARGLSRRLHIARPVQLLESTAVDVPTVIGWLKPVVLLPASALAALSPAAARGDPRARARAHPPSRLSGEPAADARRDAALLSPGGLVAVAPDPHRARELLRRSRRQPVRRSVAYASALADLESLRRDRRPRLHSPGETAARCSSACGGCSARPRRTPDAVPDGSPGVQLFS